MKIFKLKSELVLYLNHLRNSKSIGFVPTMGSLHKGHLSLIEFAKFNCDIVVCSIFVNPTQFDDSDDFHNYPRDIKDDILLLQNINCDILYCPHESDLYFENQDVEYFNFNDLDKYMEGAQRRGHFNGVATIIKKMFEVVSPEKAFFGQKDLQQLQIIKHITNQLQLNVEIIGLPTVREASGLAMSSRNKKLSKSDFKKSTLIYESLMYAKENFTHMSVNELKIRIVSRFNNQSDLELEYLEIVDLKTLTPITKFLAKDKNAVCIAASICGVRLIDNIIF